MSDTKYIVWDDGLNEVPIIFPSTVTHKDMARPFRGNIVSAGFVMFGVEAGLPIAYAYGKSESLNIDSRKEDSILITKAIL